jgi:hypothetical protein
VARAPGPVLIRIPADLEQRRRLWYVAREKTFYSGFTCSRRAPLTVPEIPA